MSMFERVATVVGYAKAPRSTYLLRNPKKGLKGILTLKGAKKGAKEAVKSPLAAAFGAVVAVPLTVMAVRKMRGS